MLLVGPLAGVNRPEVRLRFRWPTSTVNWRALHERCASARDQGHEGGSARGELVGFVALTFRVGHCRDGSGRSPRACMAISRNQIP